MLIIKIVAGILTATSNAIVTYCDNCNQKVVDNVRNSLEVGKLQADEYYVCQGETLTSISKTILGWANIDVNSVDIRKVIDLIEMINEVKGVDTGTIYEGQTIYVPNIQSLYIYFE